MQFGTIFKRKLSRLRGGKGTEVEMNVIEISATRETCKGSSVPKDRLAGREEYERAGEDGSEYCDLSVRSTTVVSC